MKNYDLICIGAGSGGIACANRAARYGAKVLVIEKSELGGTCVNLGCVPKKILFNASLVKQILTISSDYGFKNQLDKDVSWQKLKQISKEYIARIHKSYEKVFQNGKVEVIKGQAKCKDQNTIVVENEEFCAKHIVIATGMKPQSASDFMKNGDFAITSDDFFSLSELPKSIAIIGAGYIAVEIACVLNSLGVKTSLILRYNKPLRAFDDFITDALLEQLKEDGIKIVDNFVCQEIEKSGDEFILKSKTRKSDPFAKILFAAGRVPLTKNLDLEKIGVKTTKENMIVVDKYQNTSQKNIYALGDITGTSQLTPIAVKAGRTLSERLFNNQPKAHLNLNGIPTVVFSHPPIATLGLSESDAKDKFGAQNIEIFTSSFVAMIFAVTKKREPTKIKMICKKDDKRILGIHAIGYAMDEVLQGFAVAFSMNATKDDFDNTLAIHPTSAEELVTMS